jgi:peptidoglycan/LPS O-acetylase OafA/YrhL
MQATKVDRPVTINSLTGLRFIAAFSVLVAHATNWLVTFNPSPEFVNYLSWGSAIGMPLFFALSGFVIHYNYGGQFRAGIVNAIADFFIARFARLYPLYIFCLVVYLALHQNALFAIKAGTDYYLWRFVLLWQAWTIEYKSTTWFGHLLLPPAWSVSVEVFFYALYPGVAFYLLKIKKLRWAAIIFAAIVVGYYAAIIYCYVNFDALRVWGNETFTINADPQNAFLGWLLNTGPIGRFWEFLMGAVAAQAYLELRHLKPSVSEARIGSLLLTGCVLVTAILYALSRSNSFIAFAGGYPGGFAPIFAVLIFCCARYRNFITRLLSTRPIIALGDASYSIYLLHLFSLELFRQSAPYSVRASDIASWLLLMAAALSFTLIISLGTYRVIEVPARSYLRRVLHSAKRSLRISTIRAPGPAWAAPSLSMAVIVVGVTIWNLPPLRGPIVVVDATYGGNCRAQVLSPPHINNFRPGNAELAVKKACRSGDQCTFLVDVTTLGDPVNGCAKDFTVAYRCENEGASVVREATLPGEANGKAISLDCRQPHPSDRDVQQ